MIGTLGSQSDPNRVSTAGSCQPITGVSAEHRNHKRVLGTVSSRLAQAWASCGIPVANERLRSVLAPSYPGLSAPVLSLLRHASRRLTIRCRPRSVASQLQPQNHLYAPNSPSSVALPRRSGAGVRNLYRSRSKPLGDKPEVHVHCHCKYITGAPYSKYITVLKFFLTV